MPQTVSAPCRYCYGSGGIRKRDMIGRITIHQCKMCGGTGTRLVVYGSGEWRIAKQIVKGLWPGIRKHNNDRGWNRR